MRKLILTFILLPLGAGAESITAARTLTAGTVITSDDILINGAFDPDRVSELGLAGLETRVMVYEGKVVHPNRLSTPTLVDRNQIVTIAYETPAIRIEAEGRALSAAQEGQIIRVLNLSSRITVSGRVAADGTVIVEQR